LMNPKRSIIIKGNLVQKSRSLESKSKFTKINFF
jgi:hypothetical protein